jgi:hypothetical protein
VAISQLRNFLSPRYPSSVVGGVMVPGYNVGTTIPLNVKMLLPYVRVIRAPGGGRGSSNVERLSNLDVEVLASSWELMDALAGIADAGILGLKGTHFVDWVEITDPPHYVDFADPAVFRSIATYELTTRAASAA